MGQEAGATCTHDGMVNAAVSQVETTQVCQVDAGAHGIGSLAVGQAVHAVHERDEGTARGCFGRLSLDRKQVGEVAIVEHHAEVVIHPHDQSAGGEDRAGDTGGLVGDEIDHLGLE